MPSYYLLPIVSVGKRYAKMNFINQKSCPKTGILKEPQLVSYHTVTFIWSIQCIWRGIMCLHGGAFVGWLGLSPVVHIQMRRHKKIWTNQSGHQDKILSHERQLHVYLVQSRSLVNWCPQCSICWGFNPPGFVNPRFSHIKSSAKIWFNHKSSPVCLVWSRVYPQTLSVQVQEGNDIWMCVHPGPRWRQPICYHSRSRREYNVQTDTFELMSRLTRYTNADLPPTANWEQFLRNEKCR